MKGYFKPKNPKKYEGDVNRIVYRSSWELKFMSYCDTTDNIIVWASEELAIPYKSPIDGRWHSYYPDFLIKKRNSNDELDVILIEIKPYNQTKPPKRGRKRMKTFLTEVERWGVNDAKWKAAEAFCKKKGWEWQILTERELGIPT